MPFITTQDGTEIYYKDWGVGKPVFFSHGWPLTADAWEDQMFFLAARGFRCIAHDRRGHGRSSQPSSGHNMDTYTDDLAALVEKLDLGKAIHVGTLDGRRRGGALYCTPWDETCRKGCSDQRGSTIDAQDRGEPRRLADRSF